MSSTNTIVVNEKIETVKEVCLRRQESGKDDTYNEATDELLIDADDAVETYSGLVTRTTKLKVYIQDENGELEFDTETLKDQIPTKIVDERKEKSPPKMKEMPEVEFQKVYPSMYDKDKVQREHFDNATSCYDLEKSEHENFNFTISPDGSGYICYYNAESESIKNIQNKSKSVKQGQKLMEKLFNTLKVHVLCLHEQNVKNELISRMNSIEDQKIRMNINTMTFKAACVLVLVDP